MKRLSQFGPGTAGQHGIRDGLLCGQSELWSQLDIEGSADSIMLSVKGNRFRLAMAQQVT
jgi:hypothetical protein